MKALAEAVAERFEGAVARPLKVGTEIDIAPLEVTVRLGRGAADIRLHTIVWRSPYEPVASTRRWKRVALEGLDAAQLAALIEQAAEVRRAEYVRCRFCGERVPPERRVEDDVCHACAEGELGVVF